MICTLFHGRNRDWEDIAMGPGPDARKKYIYVADIGDNWAQYQEKFIYRFEEPKLGVQREVTITQFDTLTLKTTDGKWDAETILIDPLTNELYLISKREEAVGLYTIPYPFSRDTLELIKLRTLPFTKIVTGSISTDGSELLLKDYEKVYYWKRKEGESIQEVLIRKPIELPYDHEPQGEAIAWSLKGDKFYTLSEGTPEGPANLFVYPHKK
jgi:hypothetical protein